MAAISYRPQSVNWASTRRDKPFSVMLIYTGHDITAADYVDTKYIVTLQSRHRRHCVMENVCGGTYGFSRNDYNTVFGYQYITHSHCEAWASLSNKKVSLYDLSIRRFLVLSIKTL